MSFISDPPQEVVKSSGCGWSHSQNLKSSSCVVVVISAGGIACQVINDADQVFEGTLKIEGFESEPRESNEGLGSGNRRWTVEAKAFDL